MAIQSYTSRLREMSWDLCEWAKFYMNDGSVIKLKRKRFKVDGEEVVLKLKYYESGDFISLDSDDYCSLKLVPVEKIYMVEVANEGADPEGGSDE